MNNGAMGDVAKVPARKTMCKLEALRNLKSSLLAKMFVWEVSV